MPSPQPQPRASALVGAATAAAPSAATVAMVIAVFLIGVLLEFTLRDNASHFRKLRGNFLDSQGLRKFHLDERRCVCRDQSALFSRRMVNSIWPSGNSRQLSTLLM